jgi:ribonuclease HI
MRWRWAWFRRTRKVLALTSDAGWLFVLNRRVEIRFSRVDPRAYHAKPRNVRLIPGEPALEFAELPVGVDPRLVKLEKQAVKLEKQAEPRHAEPPSSLPVRVTRRPRRAAPTDVEPPRTTIVCERFTGEVDAKATRRRACWVVHTDGSYRRGQGGAGIVVVSPEGDVRERSVCLGSAASSMAAEAAALLAGLALVPHEVPVLFHTDCLALVEALAHGEPRHWEPVVVAELRAALSRFEDASVHHVRGHSGHPLNERADRLASLGRRQALAGLGLEPPGVPVDQAGVSVPSPRSLHPDRQGS